MTVTEIDIDELVDIDKILVCQIKRRSDTGKPCDQPAICRVRLYCPDCGEFRLWLCERCVTKTATRGMIMHFRCFGQAYFLEAS